MHSIYSAYYRPVFLSVISNLVTLTITILFFRCWRLVGTQNFIRNAIEW
jgi:hypothetical protein